MTETADTLKARGGIDLTKLSAGVKIWVETTAGIYKLTLTGGEPGEVIVEATESPFRPDKPQYAVLSRSIWDDKGKVFIPFWIGKAMRMVFDLTGVGLFATHSVAGARIEAADGSWHLELDEVTKQ